MLKPKTTNLYLKSLNNKERLLNNKYKFNAYEKQLFKNHY